MPGPPVNAGALKKLKLQKIEAPSEQLIFSHGQLNYSPAGVKTGGFTLSSTYRWANISLIFPDRQAEQI